MSLFPPAPTVPSASSMALTFSMEEELLQMTTNGKSSVLTSVGHDGKSFLRITTSILQWPW